MPNHCDMDLRITGPRADLEDFREFARGEDDNHLLDANKFVPEPKHIVEGNERASAKYKGTVSIMTDESRDWRDEHWGTKWGIYDTKQLLWGSESQILRYRCQSAWAPPLPVILAMSKRYPNLTFELHYYERGMGFQGVYIVERGGKVRRDKCTQNYRGERGG